MLWRNPSTARRITAMAAALCVLTGCDNRQSHDFRSVASETLADRVTRVQPTGSPVEMYLGSQWKSASVSAAKMASTDVLPVSAVWYMRSQYSGVLGLEWVEKKASITGFRIVKEDQVTAFDKHFQWTPSDHSWFANAGLHDTGISFTVRPDAEDGHNVGGRWKTIALPDLDLNEMKIVLVLADGTVTNPIPSVIKPVAASINPQTLSPSTGPSK